mgnify:CR=1 FL=1
MKLELLFKREPFKEIFNECISKFIYSKYKVKVIITWGNKNDDYNNNIFCYNSKLNIIYPRDISTDILFNVSKEYIYHKNKIRYLTQFIYVHLFTKTFFRKFFREKIYFRSPDFDLSNVIFLPGNNSVRMLDFNSQTSFVINKLDKNINVFKNSIELREKLKIKSIPLINNIDSNFYEEELISALPLNRINSNNKFHKVLGFVYSDLNSIYKSTLNLLNLESYNKKIISFLIDLEKKPLNINKKTIESINYLLEILNNKYVESTEIPITLTHGDFQNSNILVNNDRYYIIDWEFIDQRFLYYDYFTNIFSSRSPAGISSRINKWVNNNQLLINIENWSNKNIFFKRINSNTYYIALFLIEELLFRINESILSNSNKNPGLEIILNELKSINFDEK